VPWNLLSVLRVTRGDDATQLVVDLACLVGLACTVGLEERSAHVKDENSDDSDDFPYVCVC
jgi:hypothetical protein